MIFRVVQREKVQRMMLCVNSSSRCKRAECAWCVKLQDRTAMTRATNHSFHDLLYSSVRHDPEVDSLSRPAEAFCRFQWFCSLMHLRIGDGWNILASRIAMTVEFPNWWEHQKSFTHVYTLTSQPSKLIRTQLISHSLFQSEFLSQNFFPFTFSHHASHPLPRWERMLGIYVVLSISPRWGNARDIVDPLSPRGLRRDQWFSTFFMPWSTFPFTTHEILAMDQYIYANTKIA